MSEQLYYPSKKEAKYQIVCKADTNSTAEFEALHSLRTAIAFDYLPLDWINVAANSPDFSIKTNKGMWVVEVKSIESIRPPEDKKTRQEIWNGLFGDKNSPEQEDDAVTKYAGSLVIGEGLSDEEILEALDDN